MERAIVLAAGANGLGVVRGLAKEAIPSIAICMSATDAAHRSRYPGHRIALAGTSRTEAKQSLADALDSLKTEGGVLIPTSDWFVSYINEERRSLDPYFRLLSDDNRIRTILIDKASENQAVAGLVALPETLFPLPLDPESLLAQLRLPVIIKPRSHEHMCIGAKNVRLATKEQVYSFYRRYPGVCERVIAQEIVEGPDENLWVCNCTFGLSHELICCFVFRRLRLSPSHYGVTSFAVSEENSAIREHVKELGIGLKLVGPAMVEFKFDDRDGIYKYIELNPRLGMCNYFDTQCGCNNVYATYCLTAGNSLRATESTQQENNVYFLSLHDDFYSRRKDGENLFQVLLSYSKLWNKRCIFIYFSWRDPLPAIFIGANHFKAIVKSLKRKVITHFWTSSK